MAYLFKIKLEGIKKPPVWRRVIVPEDITFERFHMIIQAAFGWMDCHLYKFGDKPYHGSLEIKGTEEPDDDTVGFDAELYAALGICPRKTMRADETKLADIPYEMQRDIEVHYQNVLFIVFKLMGFYTEVEYRTAAGRVDLVLKTDSYIYVMEFKLNGTAEQAIEQIESKGYAEPFAADGRKVVKAGVGFSKAQKTIEKWIVEW